MAIDFPSNPTNGQVYANYIYDSSITAWRNVNTDTGIGTLNAMGLKNVVPTSISASSGSATVNANGTVTMNAITSVSLNGVFSSAYNRYQVVFSGTNSSGGANFYFRYRAAGADANAGNTYYCASYRFRSDSSTIINAASDNNAIVLSGGSSLSTNLAGLVTIHDVAVSGTKTLQYGQHTVLETNTLNYLMVSSSQTQGAAAYDGISFFPSAGTFTGTITVYAYNQ